MLPRSVVMFTLGSLVLPSHEALAEALAEAPLKKPGPLEISSRGFVPPSDEALVMDVGGALLIASGSWERKIPQAAVRAAMQEKCDEQERNTGIKPMGRARKLIKDEILRDILPKTLPTPGRTLAFLDSVTGMLYVEASSHNVAEGVVSEIRRALGSFPVLPLNATVTPQMIMTGWISGDPLPDGWQLGGDAVLTAAGGHKVTIKDGELQGDAVMKHLEEGLRVDRLELISERLRITLDDGLVVKRIHFLDMALEPLETDEEADVFLSRAFIGISELRTLGAAISQWFQVSKHD